jgi:type I restriction enzyme M protein
MSRNDNKSSSIGFEATLWATTDKRRGNLGASVYKHVVLGLIFLKNISDVVAEKHAILKAEKGADPEDRDEYVPENLFWLPPEARWHTIKTRAKSPEVGKAIDDAMGAIERENPTFKGVLPRDYGWPSIEKGRVFDPCCGPGGMEEKWMRFVKKGAEAYAKA